MSWFIFLPKEFPLQVRLLNGLFGVLLYKFADEKGVLITF